MFIIDVALKNTPSMLSVQRKTVEDAEALYKDILGAIQSGSPAVLELTCEKQTDKKIGILVNEIGAVQISEKSGASGSARPPGFFALTPDPSLP